MRWRLRRQNTVPSPGLFASEVIHRHWILEERVIARDDRYSAVGNEVLLPVSLRVETDSGALGDVDITVNDGPPNAAMAANVHMREQDAGVHLGVGVHPHVGRKNAVADGAPRDDASGGND